MESKLDKNFLYKKISNLGTFSFLIYTVRYYPFGVLLDVLFGCFNIVIVSLIRNSKFFYWIDSCLTHFILI